MTRYLLYSHDTFGLGHLRRCTRVAEGLVAANEANEVLIITGSPRASAFPLPARVDTLKLPTVTKGTDGRYRPRKLGMSQRELVTMRAGAIAATAAAYRPDVVLVDHAPTGMGDELLPALQLLLAQPDRPHLVLGLREIIDSASRVEAAWREQSIWPWLERYDEILVYGDERLLTTATELELGKRLGAPVTHTGYIAPQPAEPRGGEPFLLCTTGGGGDGHAVVRAYLEAVAGGATDGLRSIVVTGPLLSPRRRASTASLAAGLSGVEIVEFDSDLRTLMASAAGVVSMAGYNTVAEELAAGVPTLLVPRRHPRLEQHLRASRLKAHGLVDACTPSELTSQRLAAFARRCRATVGDARAPSPVDLSGVATTCRALARPSGAKESIHA